MRNCEHKNCKRRAVWKLVTECMVGASEWNFYCQKHVGSYLSTGAESYFKLEGWLAEKVGEN